MDLATLAQGILGTAIAIVLLGTAAGLIPPTLALQAAGLILLGIALTGIAAAIGLMGGMSVEQMAKGILGLGAALVILGIGLTAMSGAIPGTIALLGAAVALSILVPVLGILGNMKWETIGKGIAAIAAVLATIAVVGLIAAPALALVGVALVILGAGVAAIGAGVYLIAKGIALLGAEGQKGVAVMVTALTAFVALIPRIVIDFVKGLVAIVDGIVALAPEIVGAFSKILILILDTVIMAAPKAGQAMIVLITTMLAVLNSQAGPLIQAGWNLIQKLLSGFSQHAGELATTAAQAVANLLNGLSAKAGELVTAGGNLVISILRGVANQQSRMITVGVLMITNFLRGIANNVGRVISAGLDLATKLVSKIASAASRMINTGTDFIVKMVTGIGNAGSRLVTAGTSAAAKFVRSIAKGLVKMIDEGEKAIIDFMNGVASALRENQDELNAAGQNLASAIIDGAMSFFTSQADNLVQKIVAPFKRGLELAKKAVGANSPAKKFIELGKNIMDGAGLGIVRNSAGVIASITDAAYPLIGVGETMGNNLALGIASSAKNVNHASEYLGKTAWAQVKKIQQSNPQGFNDLGKYIGKEFTKGLHGSSAYIVNAFDSLSNQISSSIDASLQSINTERVKLKDLLDNKHIDLKAIAKAQAVINQNQIFIDKAQKARVTLNSRLKKEQDQLIAASARYDTIVEKLKQAQSDLDAAISARDSAAKSFKDQYSALPDLGEVGKQSAAAYVSDLRTRAAAVEKFRVSLEQLRAMGLDNATYQKLLSEGPDAQGFVTQLIAGGPAMVAEINAIDNQLAASAGALGTSASTNLYQAGVDAAQGLVNGLNADKATVETEIENLINGKDGIVTKVNAKLEKYSGGSKVFERLGLLSMKGLLHGLDKRKGHVYEKIKEIAEGMIDQLKKSLGIHSPSQVFAELGRFTAFGMAGGIASGATVVNSAVSDMGDSATNTLRDSLKNMAELTANEIDANPVIAPVLDLSDIKAGAKKLADLTNVTPITAAASYSQAASIASSRTQAQGTSASESAPTQEIKFEQNNYSPEALSEVEIYRQTNNQLSQARRALGLVG